MQHIWTAFLPILVHVALVSAIQRELENTDKLNWHWISKQQSGVLGVSFLRNCGTTSVESVGFISCVNNVNWPP